ncbi:hypothetical protein DITRI_Ditri11bG0013800 [Diplodiscus trichospermus]
MGRRRMEMKLIENEKARKRVFEKRRNSLLKKAKELSILCDIKTLIIIYELDKQKPEIWPHNDEEAEQIINKFKQQCVRRTSKKDCDSLASKKTRFGDKFAMSDHKSMINQLTENELQKFCCKLDAKIAAVMNAIDSKQTLTEGPRSPKTFGDSQETGFLKKGKGKEVVIYQEPVPTRQNQSFQMLSDNPNFSCPEFDGSSSSISIPYVPLPIHYDVPSWMQPAYMDANSSMGCYDSTIYHIPPGSFYPVMPRFSS